MRFIHAAVFALVVFGTAVPLSARDDDDDDKPAPKKDEKKKDDDKKGDDKKGDDKKGDDKKKDDDKSGDDKTDEKIPDCEYYPLAVGTTWTYELSVNGVTQTVKIGVAEHEKVSGRLCARLETQTAQGATAEHVMIKPDGVYRCSVNGVKIEPPVRIFKLPPKKGDEWKVKSKQGAASIKGTFTSDEDKDVDVPAGTFDTLKVTGEISQEGQTVETICWFAKGRGVVKMQINYGGQSITVELKKFKKGTGKAEDDEDKKDDEKKDEKKDDGKKDGEKKKGDF